MARQEGQQAAESPTGLGMLLSEALDLPFSYVGRRRGPGCICCWVTMSRFAGGTPCYIGEADVVSERLRSHEQEKDSGTRSCDHVEDNIHEGAWACWNPA